MNVINFTARNMLARIIILLSVFPAALMGQTLVIQFEANVTHVYGESAVQTGDELHGIFTADLNTLPVVSSGGSYHYYLYYTLHSGSRNGLNFSVESPNFNASYQSGEYTGIGGRSSMIVLRNDTDRDSAGFQVDSPSGDQLLSITFGDESAPYELVTGSQIPLSFGWETVDKAVFSVWTLNAVEFEAEVADFTISVIPEPSLIGISFGVVVLGAATIRNRMRHRCKFMPKVFCFYRGCR